MSWFPAVGSFGFRCSRRGECAAGARAIGRTGCRSDVVGLQRFPCLDETGRLGVAPGRDPSGRIVGVLLTHSVA